MYTDCMKVVAISTGVALVQEAVNYGLVYRTSAYRGVKESIDRASKKLDSLRSGAQGNEKQVKKKEKHMTAVMKSAQKDLATIKMKSSFVVAALLFVGYKALSSHFDGVVVAKLPFEPFPFVRGMSHRGLAGDDFTDCSMAFLYAMCASSIRLNVAKLLGDIFGFSPPRSMNNANPFVRPEDAMAKAD
mmetsp:Transcript_9305/g.23732  ORF Transcript_9305/g.23732 Transcript_9305/m.23732 type:complete len:188 (+) Transcript_9305:154-717(+)